MVDKLIDVQKFIEDRAFKKIFVLCGKKSFSNSGAEIFLKKIVKNKEINLFFIKTLKYQFFQNSLKL